MTQTAFNLDKERIIKNLLEELNKYYPPGLYEWLYKYNKSRYTEIIKIEDELDNVILSGTEEDTKKLLLKYWQLHKTAIEEFRNNQLDETDINYAEVRKEMLEERVSI